MSEVVAEKKERLSLPTLIDILNDYKRENPSDCCDRLDSVIAFIGELRDQHRVDMVAYLSKLKVTDADDEEEKQKKEAFIMPTIVLWYDTSFFFWEERTYAVFLVSFIATFFNARYQMGKESDDPSTKDVAKIQSQFGRILKYLHKECPYITPYFESIWNYNGNNCPTISTSWRTQSPYAVYKRVITVWASILNMCNAKGNTEGDKVQLFEAFLNKNVTLLQKGLDIPLVLAYMAMHYNTAKLDDLCASMVADSMVDGEEEENTTNL